MFPNLFFEHYNIRLRTIDDVSTCVDFYNENKDHLAPWENILLNYFNEEYWQARITQDQNDFKNFTNCNLCIFDNNKMIGCINFHNITRGCFYSSPLGYKIAEKYQGRGIMKNCLKIAINYAFAELNLHRLAASHMLNNIRSAKLLKSLGFQNEGVAVKYLHINGEWRDHVLTALINDNWSI